MIKTLVITPNQQMLQDAMRFFKDEPNVLIITLYSIEDIHKKLAGTSFTRVLILGEELIYRNLGVMGHDELMYAIRCRNANAPILRN